MEGVYEGLIEGPVDYLRRLDQCFGWILLFFPRCPGDDTSVDDWGGRGGDLGGMRGAFAFDIDWGEYGWPEQMRIPSLVIKDLGWVVKMEKY